MLTSKPPSFEQPHLAKAVEELSPEEIDALPFGAIRLDASGQVVTFNKAEAQLSGYGGRPTLGHDFFREIAPCMSGENFRGRIDRAAKAGRVDIEFSHVGDFDDRDRELRVRIQSAGAGGIWIFITRD